MKSNLKLVLSLFAILLGFGSQWNCTIQFGEASAPQQEAAPPPPSYGCMNQQPVYTLGERPSKDEYTIIVQEFGAKQSAEAHRLSAELRATRVYNSVWPQVDGMIAVSVGRYWTKKQAEDKLRGIHARGYTDAYVAKPKTKAEKKEEEPKPDYAGLFALMIIVVLVILGVASQTKK